MAIRAAFEHIVPFDPISIFSASPGELDEIPLGVIALDRLGFVKAYNQAEAQHARRSPQTSLGRNFFDLAPCACVEAYEGRFRRFALGTTTESERFRFTYPFRWGSRDVDIMFVRREGDDRIFIMTQSAGLAVLVSMTSEAERAAERVRLIETRPALVRRLSPEAIWFDDLILGETRWSDALYAMCDLDVGTHRQIGGLSAFTHPEDRAAVEEFVASAFAARSAYGFEQRIVTARGRVRYVQIGASVSYDDDGRPTAVYGRAADVTTHRREDEALWELANTDRLTNLANRLRFETCFERELDNTTNIGKTLGLIMVDLDRFKPINDTFGHKAGDDVLCEAAGRLAASVRPSDLVARLGGDEFAILLRDFPSEDVVDTVCQRLHREMQKPFVVEGQDLEMTASIGVSLYPRDGADRSALLHSADTAMYESKRAGRNRVTYFDVDVAKRRGETARLEFELAHAIEQGEFELHYQIIIDAQSQAIVGAESLCRWNHPTRGRIPPDEFIPIAEANGTIFALGAWVIGRVCERIRATIDAGIAPIPLWVNVSLVQFRSPLFVDTVRETLRRSMIPPELLVLEITESFASADFGETVRALAALKAIGVKIAIDDFGTGYSSLAYLKNFPIDYIKLDRSFVEDILVTPIDRVIAEAVVKIARELEIDIVAEGIETLEQATCMKALGCRRLQGYFFGRPAPIEAFFDDMTLRPVV